MPPRSIGLIQITQPKIIIVEGIEEERFLQPLFNYILLAGIQILPIGGKTLLPDRLQTLSKTASFISTVQVLGIMRDADNDASAAFQSVCSALGQSNLPIPTAVLEPAGTNPTVRVMIVPHGKTSGMLEDICLDTVSTDPAISCVDSYFRCLSSISGFTLPNNMSKARVHAFLSSRIEPDKRLGEAAEAGYWPFNNAALDSLKTFLLSL